MKTVNLWKTGALALALGMVCTLPSSAKPRDDKRERKQERREDKRERKQDRRNNNGTYNNGYNNNGYNTNRNVFTGVVTNRRSSTQFDIRVGGQTYNVYTTNGVPRGLDRDDLVRVVGQRVGSNDIRYASATVIRQR